MPYNRKDKIKKSNIFPNTVSEKEKEREMKIRGLPYYVVSVWRNEKHPQISPTIKLASVADRFLFLNLQFMKNMEDLDMMIILIIVSSFLGFHWVTGEGEEKKKSQVYKSSDRVWSWFLTKRKTYINSAS